MRYEEPFAPHLSEHSAAGIQELASDYRSCVLVCCSGIQGSAEGEGNLLQMQAHKVSHYKEDQVLFIGRAN